MDEQQGQTWNAGLYDASHSFVWKYGASLIELLAPQAGEKILDLGAGTGHLTSQIAAAGAKVVGIDASAEMIEKARQSHPTLRFEVADARTFDLGETFDAGFSNAVLHWVKPPEQAVRQISAALRPGGRFVAEFGGTGNTRTVIDSLFDEGKKLGLDGLVNPWYFPSIAEYSQLLERNGLETTSAMLFDRWTPLEGADGLRNWLKMFGGCVLDRIVPAEREPLLNRIEDQLRPKLFQDGQWHADYRRLRIVAKKR